MKTVAEIKEVASIVGKTMRDARKSGDRETYRYCMGVLDAFDFMRFKNCDINVEETIKWVK